MSKRLFIAEKPSVAQEFAKALHENFAARDGYRESEKSIVTWCVGHLVSMSYPEVYDPALKKWSEKTLPFLPENFLYEVIPNVKKQFDIVKGLLCREDVDTIYICTDSGREGEYIYRLVDMEAQVPESKVRRRVWIDSQTEEEIQRGIKEAKTWEAYDSLSEAAFLRAKEDYLMGINFSRILSLKYGDDISRYLGNGKKSVIAVGRVMTCVLGMVVRREREIREFVKTPFFRVIAKTAPGFEAEFRATEGSKYFGTPAMYKENGFKERKNAEELIERISGHNGSVSSIEKKKENKNAPLLYNLAEIQNDCSKIFKISPDETLKIIQELYEKKLVTYPRTDARVLSSAVAKEIYRNLGGLKNYQPFGAFASEILEKKTWTGIGKSRYTDDRKITDHYAIIPTGQGLSEIGRLSPLSKNVYDLIVGRFISIFYPPAVYRKISLVLDISGEHFYAGFKMLADEGYMKVTSVFRKDSDRQPPKKDEGEEVELSSDLLETIEKLKKGDEVVINGYEIKEGETSPPKRYTSGSLILAMENAGQLIEDEELRAQIKGSGIGTSATRAEILNKLVKNGYLQLIQKTQVILPSMHGEMIYEVVNGSIAQLLRADLTASWEKGLTMVAEGTITSDEYKDKLFGYVSRMTDRVKMTDNRNPIRRALAAVHTGYMTDKDNEIRSRS